jgi:hypothetical protein
MAGWVWLLIAIASYVTGFLLSGVAYSYLFTPGSYGRSDIVGAMVFWPVVSPCYGVYRGITAYIDFLENTRDKRIRKAASKVTTLTPKSTTLLQGKWETHE